MIGVGAFSASARRTWPSPFSQLKFVQRTAQDNDEIAQLRPTPTPVGTAANPNPACGTSENRCHSVGRDHGTGDHPDHAVINTTRDQLKAAP